MTYDTRSAVAGADASPVRRSALPRSVRPSRTLLSALLLAISCGGAPTTPCCDRPPCCEPPPCCEAGTTRVLFVGNSLTYTNDLPQLVDAVARQAGVTTLRTAVLARPNYSLEEHWNEGTAPQWLRATPWQFVVLQQGPSALPESQQHLRSWTERFAPLIRDAGGTPVLLMVWPSQARLTDFPGVQQSYRSAAQAVNGLFAPGGDAWVAYGDLGALYADGLHPTVFGSYLAALTVLERIAGVRPDQLPPTIPGVSADTTVVRALQAAAWTAIQRNTAPVIR